jgi:hypothetical protein
VWQITWKPFDLRLKDIVTRFENNCAYVTHRIQALHCREQAKSATEIAGMKRDKAESEEQRRIATKKELEAAEHEQIAATSERKESARFRERYSTFDSDVRQKLEMEARCAKGMFIMSPPGLSAELL